MDTPTRTRSSRIALFLCLVVSAAILGSKRAGPARPQPLTVHGATAAEEGTIDWAIRRYHTAGLDGMPNLEVVLHRSDEGCNGGIGLYYSGRIDLCTKDASEPYQRKFALHEMAHAWTEVNIDAQVLERFMDVRGIAAWNDRSFDWKERGIEQVAEIITWGLGEGEIAPLLPEITDPETLARLYRLLTARDPITPAAR
jgi:hypothetical protein